jgi:hypothetical protein
MIRKTALAALAAALPLAFGAIAPASAQTRDHYYGDRYDRYYDGDYYGRDHYDRYDGDRYYGDRFYGRYRFLSPRQIVYRLSRYGYSRINNVSYSRYYRAYRADARDWRGYRVRLTVSPYSGRVISARIVSYSRPYRRRDYYVLTKAVGTSLKKPRHLEMCGASFLLKRTTGHPRVASLCCEGDQQIRAQRTVLARV